MKWVVVFADEMAGEELGRAYFASVDEARAYASHFARRFKTDSIVYLEEA